jgi:hypothetical protein
MKFYNVLARPTLLYGSETRLIAKQDMAGLEAAEMRFLRSINPLTPELNPSAHRCLTRFFTGDFASLTVHFFNIYVKNQQIHQLFIQFINYVC